MADSKGQNSVNVLSCLRVKEAVPQLICLLKFSYSDLEENDLNSWFNIACEGISAVALDSEENLTVVTNEIKDFIQDNRALKYVNNLVAFIEKLEQKFYTKKSQQYDVEDVLALLAEKSL